MKYNKGTARKNREKHASRRARVASRPPAIKMKIKKGDTVKVISGKDKGKQGEVTRALPRANRAVVEGINVSKRHLRSTGRGQSGRIVERPMPIHASNLTVVSSKKTK
ncbi:MAG: 50S ribosomal protein L24 [Minisyncoccia bacterium]